jgi:hypothetical protein
MSGLQGLLQQRRDGRVNPEKIQAGLQRVGNLIAQKRRAPRLLMEFDKLYPRNGG